MKVRNGFVSNSSSSSYLIAFERDIEEDVLREMFDPTGRSSGDGTYVKAYGIDDVMHFVKLWYIYDLMHKEGRIYLYKLCSKIAKQIDSGKNVAWVNISHHNEQAHDIMNHSDNMEVLEFIG